MPLGLHVTISPKPIFGIREAEALNADTIQIFTHNPRGWSFKALDHAALNEFKTAAQKAGISTE